MVLLLLHAVNFACWADLVLGREGHTLRVAAAHPCRRSCLSGGPALLRFVSGGLGGDLRLCGSGCT